MAHQGKAVLSSNGITYTGNGTRVAHGVLTTVSHYAIAAYDTLRHLFFTYPLGLPPRLWRHIHVVKVLYEHVERSVGKI